MNKTRKERDRRYYLANRDKILMRQRQYYCAHREECKRVVRAYQATHLEEKNSYMRGYVKKRNKLDRSFYLLNVLRIRISKALSRNYKKAAKSSILLGAPIAVVRAHLEARFQTGMTWENHGKWHIDHIRPCASFDLSDPVQQKICFHYSNLQPLWAADNAKKGAKC